MLSRFSFAQAFAFGQQARKPKSAHQRIKFYARFPDKFRLKTKMRAPDLTDPSLSFPIRIPIRYRHGLYLRKKLFVDDSSKVHWNRLEPNQILLALENPQYLEFRELTEGLRCLSEVKGQEQHDWNQHEGVGKALHQIRDNFQRIRKAEVMPYYFLMKKLGYTDAEFWRKMYAKLEEELYDLHSQHFELLFVRYYGRFDEVFSQGAAAKFEKLMEGRIRKFSPSSIVSTFEHFMNEGRLDDTYWLENVFISLFKEERYYFTPQHVAQIFRFMMILGHEVSETLFRKTIGCTPASTSASSLWSSRTRPKSTCWRKCCWKSRSCSPRTEWSPAWST